MYESLQEHSDNFHLFIFAFDNISCRILKSLSLQNVTIVSLQEFETPELLAVKNERSKGEYCWTCTPSTISYVLNKLQLPNCTYLDADLIFYSDPAVLIDEMVGNNKNVLITEHRFSQVAKLYELNRAGRFCVQFVTFTNDSDSLEILEKWRLQCIDWCYARYEDGKFGDQKYLDEWPLNYKNIHILNNIGGGVAPWNLQQYYFDENEGSIEGKVRKSGVKFRLVFFHFQYVRFIETGLIDIGWYCISKKVKNLFYLPYLRNIIEIENSIMKNDSSYRKLISDFSTGSLKNIIKKVIKKTFRYNLVKISN